MILLNQIETNLLFLNVYFFNYLKNSYVFESNKYNLRLDSDEGRCFLMHCRLCLIIKFYNNNSFYPSIFFLDRKQFIMCINLIACIDNQVSDENQSS